MTIVTMTIHKHECAICHGHFSPREYEGSCTCPDVYDTPDRIETCKECTDHLTEAGWLGRVVRGLVEEATRLHRRADALENREQAIRPAEVEPR